MDRKSHDEDLQATIVAIQANFINGKVCELENPKVQQSGLRSSSKLSLARFVRCRKYLPRREPVNASAW